MYRDNTTDDNYPKTLLIRNTHGNMIWQVYHVEAAKEAEGLSKTAASNGFMDRELVDYQPEQKQTWPDWRETEGGKKIIETGTLL